MPASSLLAGARDAARGPTHSTNVPKIRLLDEGKVAVSRMADIFISNLQPSSIKKYWDHPQHRLWSPHRQRSHPSGKKGARHNHRHLLRRAHHHTPRLPVRSPKSSSKKRGQVFCGATDLNPYVSYRVVILPFATVTTVNPSGVPNRVPCHQLPHTAPLVTYGTPFHNTISLMCV